MSNIEKLNKLAVEDHSNWLGEIEERIRNRDWLDLSADIAMKVLRELRRTGRSREDLAKEMGITLEEINTILSGNENLDIKTIFNLGKAMDMELIQIKVDKPEVYKLRTRIMGHHGMYMTSYNQTTNKQKQMLKSIFYA